MKEAKFSSKVTRLRGRLRPRPGGSLGCGALLMSSLILLPPTWTRLQFNVYCREKEHRSRILHFVDSLKFTIYRILKRFEETITVKV